MQNSNIRSVPVSVGDMVRFSPVYGISEGIVTRIKTDTVIVRVKHGNCFEVHPSRLTVVDRPSPQRIGNVIPLYRAG